MYTKRLGRVIIAALMIVATCVAESPTVNASNALGRRVGKLVDESTAIYKIEAKETMGAPPGCVNGCPSVKTNVPSFIAQDETYAELAGASKIDTFISNQTCGPTGCSSTQSGCAIVNGGLWCWGGNSSGQLGTGDTTDRALPTKILEDGQPLSGVTDLATNGSTTCIIDDGAVRCVGSGNFNSYKSVTRNISENVTRYTKPNTQTNSGGTVRCETDFLNDANVVVSTNTGCGGGASLTTSWLTIVASKAKKVQVGPSNGLAPPVCVLLETGKVDCLLSTSSMATGNETETSSSQVYDCNDDGTYETSTYCPRSEQVDADGNRTWVEGAYRTKYISTSKTTYPAVKLNWQTVPNISNAVDISMPSDSWGSSMLCIAAASSVSCRTFSNGAIGKGSTVKGSEGAEAVWITSGWGPSGLCLYAAGTMKCGAGTSGPTGTTFATSVTPVAVMEKPLNVFYGMTSSMSKIYFLLPSGILSADAWIFNCSGCYTNANSVVAPVTSFSDAAAKSFFSLTGVTGSTDSADFIPLALKTGTRASRASVQITVRAGDQILSGTTVKWMAPDYPGQYQSSAASSLKTDTNGSVKTSLVSGPVTFTLSGGSIKSGATLQAASVTVLVSDSGNVDVTVPLPGEVIQRKVSVTLPDGSSVPNATVTLRNNYLMYAYANSGGSTSSWSSRGVDSRGWFAQTNCAFCYVPPPVLITGADGSVTFPSFNISSRSTAYDADVTYDDGELNQNVQATFSDVSSVVAMSFMAKVAVQVADADKSTPDIDVDADANGAQIEVEIEDQDGSGISDKQISSETTCASMESGGLSSSSVKVDNICTSGVSSAAVKTFATSSGGCQQTSRAVTNASGKATIKLCPTSSTRIRLRGSGVLASTIICVRVNGAKCNSAATFGPPKPNLPNYLQASTRVLTKQYTKAFTSNVFGGPIRVRSAGACTIVGKWVVAAAKPGTCKVIVTQTVKGLKKPLAQTFEVRVKPREPQRK